MIVDTTLLKDKLEQIGTWQLFGNVTCMKSVRLTGADQDSILLSFQDAKVYMNAIVKGYCFLFANFIFSPF